MRSPTLLILALAACGDVDKTTDSAPDSEVPDDTSADDSAEPNEQCGAITADTTWTADQNPYLLTCELRVEGATLTIQPGVRVIASPRASLEIGGEFPGALVVEGSEAEPVRFLPADGDVRGGWSGVVINPEGEATLSWMEIDGAGTGRGANLAVRGAEVLVDNLTLQDSSAQGLLLADGGRLHPDSANLRILGSGGWPALGGADVIHTLPATGSDYTGNDTDAVAMEAADVTEAVEWEDLGVPYAVLGNVDLEGVAAAPAVLTIGPGVALLFDDGRSLRLSRAGGESGLIVGDLAGDTVRMTSLGAASPGSWGGIIASDGTEEVTLRNTLLEYSGGAQDGSYDGAIFAEANIELLLEEVTIRGSGTSAVFMETGARVHEDSHTLQFTGGLNLPILVGADQAHTIPLEDYTGNVRDAIGVTGETVPISVTWPDHGIPFVIYNDVKMEGITAAPAVLTIEAGVELYFKENAAIFLSLASGASGLITQGEPGDEVLMSSDGAGVPGMWSGIGIYNGADADLISLNHTIVEYAGDEAFEAAIFMETSGIHVQDLVVRHSRDKGMLMIEDSYFQEASSGLEIYGCDQPIVVSAGAAHTVPRDAVLTGNTWDFLFVRNDEQVTQSVSWGPIGGVDWWIEDTIRVQNRYSDGVTLTLEPGLVLRFAAGKGLEVGSAENSGTATLITQGTANQPVVLNSASAYHHGAWTGLTLGPRCENLTADLTGLDIDYGSLYLYACSADVDDLSVRYSADTAIDLNADAHIQGEGLSISDTWSMGLRMRRDSTLNVLDFSVTDTDDTALDITGSIASLRGTVNISGSGNHGVDIDSANVSLDGATIDGSAGHGIWFSDTAGDNTILIDDCAITNSGMDGVHFIDDADGATLQDSSISGSSGYGLYVEPTVRQPTLNNVTYANNALGNTGP